MLTALIMGHPDISNLSFNDREISLVTNISWTHKGDTILAFPTLSNKFTHSSLYLFILNRMDSHLSGLRFWWLVKSTYWLNLGCLRREHRHRMVKFQTKFVTTCFICSTVLDFSKTQCIFFASSVVFIYNMMSKLIQKKWENWWLDAWFMEIQTSFMSHTAIEVLADRMLAMDAGLI